MIYNTWGDFQICISVPLKSILQNFLFKQCASLMEALQHRHF